MLEIDMSSQWLAVLGISSIVMFVLSLILIPIAVIRIPHDYFVNENNQKQRWQQYQPAIRYTMYALKNLLGLILVLLGILMLVLPGQGLVAIFLGIVLLDFPGKAAIERKLIAYPPILNAMNWIRQRAKRKPLLV